MENRHHSSDKVYNPLLPGRLEGEQGEFTLNNKTDKIGENGYDHNYLQTEQFIEGTVLTVICIVAVVGNISIWIIVLRSRTLRTITNSFLLTLSAFDLLVSLINMPVTILTIFSGEWILSEAACRWFGFSNMVTLCGSVLSLCNISINRYVMVCRPNSFYRIYTRKKAALFIIGTVFVTIAVSTPPLVGWSEYRYTPVQYICFADWPNSLSYSLFMISCCFGIPLCVMMVCNFKIYTAVKTSRSKVCNTYVVQNSKSETESSVTINGKSQKDRMSVGNDIEPEPDIQLPNTPEFENKVYYTKDKFKKCTCNGIGITDKKIIKTIENTKDAVQKSIINKVKPEEVRLAVVLGIVVLVFSISWFPYCVSMILSIVTKDNVHRGFHMGTLLIGYANSCCNPIIYGLLNKRFKDGFKKLYCFWR